METPNITINTNVSGESSSQSPINKILDLGFKVLIPVLLIGALLVIYIVFKLVLPLLGDVSDAFGFIFGEGYGGAFLSTVPIIGGLLSFLYGRTQ